MSPASRSKSKDKKISKETQKPALKSSAPANAGSSIPASAYNPLLGTFHTLEFSSSVAPAIQTNGRFRNIDVTDEHLGIAVTAGVEYDSVSNNGSWSGESEGHKTSNSTVRLETVPGADNDKREKTRLKNERKHQRQKERRAQELHERCTGYLMSRKLESLAQQLVAMGFSQERATAALVSNEGKVEESVAWLFEGGEEVEQPRDQNLTGGGLKIDISEELAQIADLELRFKCSKQEVERAIVASEGDFEQAIESLRELKLDLPSDPPKPEETVESSTASNYNPSNTPATNLLQAKANSHTMQLRKSEKDFNYTKATVIVGGSTDPANKGVQPLKRIPKLEWAKLQQTALPSEKRWPNPVSNPPPSYSLTSSSLQAAPLPTKPETRYVAVGTEFKNLHPSSVREPVIMVQRPQSIGAKQIPATSSMSSSPPGGALNWGSSNGIEILKPSGFMPQVHGARSLNPNNLTANQLYHQFQHQQQPQFIPSNSNGGGEFHAPNRANSSWGRSSASPTVAAASSLGLFSGTGSIGSSGSSSPVDWSTGGSMLHLDYTNIDWSLNKGLPSPGGAGGLLQGFSSFVKNNVHMIDSNVSRADIHQPLMRPTPNLNGVSLAGLQEGRGASANESSNTGMRVWSSPFEEKDLFSLPRQFVSSPPL